MRVFTHHIAQRNREGAITGIGINARSNHTGHTTRGVREFEGIGITGIAAERIADHAP